MSRKKYFFFNFKDKDEDEDMGRRRNRNKKNRNQKVDTKACGFGQYSNNASSSSDEDTSSFTTVGSNFYHHAYKTQEALDPERVIASDQGFLEFHHSEAWGTALIPVDNPSAVKVTLEELNGIKLIDNFPKIPAALWSRWIALCRYFCERQSKEQKPKLTKKWNHDTREYDYFRYFDGEKVKIANPEKVLGPGAKYGAVSGVEYEHDYPTTSYSTSSYQNELEVSALLCRKADDLSQWKILIPKQEVSHSSVRAETKKSVDIETGEVHEIFPPLGWVHAGSSHSHNTFSPFFSSTDDNSELTVPGLHIVVGSIKITADTYDARASIVLRRLRKHVKIDDVVEIEAVEGVTFHTNVLEYVSNLITTSTTYSSTRPSLDLDEIDARIKESQDRENDTSDNDDSGDDDSSACGEDDRSPGWWKSLWIRKNKENNHHTPREAEDHYHDPREDYSEPYGWC